MGLFSSSTKTTYYSNHIALAKLNKQFKPYVNSLVMSTALQTDRYTSATEILIDGLGNSPRRGLLNVFKHQARTLGRAGELYAPSGDLVNFNYKPYLGIGSNEELIIEDLEVSYLEPDYYVTEWVIKNRPELVHFIDKFEVTYDNKTKIATLSINNERIPIPINSKASPNTRTLYMVYYTQTNTGISAFREVEPISSEKVSGFSKEEVGGLEGFSLKSSNSTPKKVMLLEEKTTINTSTGEATKNTIYSDYEPTLLREDIYENRNVTQSEYDKGIVGYEIVVRERVFIVDHTKTRQYPGTYNNNGSLTRTTYIEDTETQTVHKEIIKTKSAIMEVRTPPRKYGVFIYHEGSGIPAIDKTMNSRASLGYKLQPLIVKRNNSLISPHAHPKEFEYNDKVFKKYSGGAGNYMDAYRGFNEDGLLNIKEAILLFGMPVESNIQFCLEYAYKFFSHVLDFYRRSEGTVNMNGICKQNVGNLYYDPGIGNVTRKKHTGVYDSKYKIGRVYVKRNVSSNSSGGLFKRKSRSNVMYILRTSAVTYTTIVVELHGQSAMSSVHWMSHGIDGASGDNENAGVRIPLLEGVVKSLSLKYSSDITKYCTSVLLTTFETVKIKWYQKSFMKILTVGIMIAISIIFPPAGGATAAVAGTIGATVASYMALTGLSYLVVAYAVNAVIGMVVAKLVTSAVSKFVGGQLGQLLSTMITNFAMGAMLSNQPFSQTFSNMFDKIFDFEYIMNFSNASKALEIGANKYLKGRMDKLEEMQKDLEKLQDQIKDVQEKTDELFGKSGLLDTRSLMDAISDSLPSDIMSSAETLDTFIGRSTLKGSQVVDMTLSSVYDFVEIGLSQRNFLA